MRILAATFLAVLFMGCATAQTTDPKTQKLVVANQMLQRLEELQDTVTDLYATQSIDPKHALVYSKFIVSATRTIKTVPDGWIPVIRQSWAEVKQQVPLDQMEIKVQVTAKLIDAMVNSL